MINLNKQLMVRKMSELSENLLFLLDLGRRKPKNQRRTLEEPTTEYDYLNSYLTDNIDIYVAQFEGVDPKVSSEYAKNIKNQLSTKIVSQIADPPFAQLNEKNPTQIITFTDGTELSVPKKLVQQAKEQADLKEVNLQNAQQQANQQIKNKDVSVENKLKATDLMTVSKGQNTNLSDDEMEKLVFGQSSDKLYMDGQTSLDFITDNGIVENINFQESVEPNIEYVTDGNYLYTLVNGEPTEIMNITTSKIIDEDEITPEAREVILEKYNEKYNEFKETEPIPKEETEINQSKASRIQAIPTSEGLKSLNETIAKEQPEKLKNLGQKVKEGYQGLTKEQKAMGLLMGLDVGLEAVNYLGPARKEARDRIEILEDRRERGQLGVDERQDAETMKYMTRPVRAMAEESEREQQAVMAGMGETRSAADLRRLRESRDAQMTDALSRAGQEVARQQMARKEAEKRELNQLQAYQQENLRNLTNRISGSVAQMAGTFGANVAAEADIQKELSPDTIDKYTKIIMDSDPSLTQEEARRMATDYGMGRAKKKVDYAQFLSGVRNPPF
jgi:hypothetical protein